MTSFHDFIEQFRSAMTEKGIYFSGQIIPDTDRIQRFDLDGSRSGSKAGYYILHTDNIPAGIYGAWNINSGSYYTWSAKSLNDLNLTQRSEFFQRLNEIQLKHEKAQNDSRIKAAERARNIWKHSAAASKDHPYLVKKQIAPYGARQHNSCLILPIMSFDKTLHSLQFISPDGSKKLLSEGAKKSHFIPVNGFHNMSLIMITEGWATGCTIASAYPDACTIAAIDAGNLQHVAINARHLFLKSRIIICGDDDRKTIGNPGLTKGRHAAENAGAIFISPTWPDDSPDSLTDFNDLACWINKNAKEAV